jgi:hypothetical protein
MIFYIFEISKNILSIGFCNQKVTIKDNTICTVQNFFQNSIFSPLPLLLLLLLLLAISILYC